MNGVQNLVLTKQTHKKRQDGTQHDGAQQEIAEHDNLLEPHNLPDVALKSLQSLIQMLAHIGQLSLQSLFDLSRAIEELKT